MRWPWISRVAYDDMVASYTAEREHNRKLTRILLRLKVSQQAFLPAKHEVQQARVVDRIEAAINHSKHAKNPVIRQGLSEWAARETALGKLTPEEIEHRLLHWDDLRDDAVEDSNDDELVS